MNLGSEENMVQQPSIKVGWLDPMTQFSKGKNIKTLHQNVILRHTYGFQL